jgi:asparagine synthase (glutamine-hydrolysing)
VKVIGTLSNPFGTSRSNAVGDRVRKIQKLKKGMELSHAKRYFEWCTFISEKDKNNLLAFSTPNGYDDFYEYSQIKEFDDFNMTLFSDQKMVLPNDMLKKVDVMSMASSLEVRTPFLDHLLVDFVNSLPANFKVNDSGGKQILKDTFSHELPDEIIHRPKRGFEIPIEEWLGDILTDLFNQEMFSENYIKRQNIFNWSTINRLKETNLSEGNSDKIYLIWSLIVFQYWYKNNLPL